MGLNNLLNRLNKLEKESKKDTKRKLSAFEKIEICKTILNARVKNPELMKINIKECYRRLKRKKLAEGGGSVPLW